MPTAVPIDEREGLTSRVKGLDEVQVEVELEVGGDGFSVEVDLNW